MYELVIPGSLTVFPTPEATLSKPEPGLRHGLLLWVLAGHAAAAWLAFEQIGPREEYVEPKVLSVRWIAPESRPEPAPAVPARISPPKPRPVKRLADPVQVQPQPQPQVKPVADPVVPTPPAPPVEAPPMVAPAAPPAAVPVHAAPPPVEEPIPPSYHADYLANPAPEYPSLSRRAGEEGVVRLRVHVSSDGLPLEISLAASSGHPRLDQAARDAVADWRFVPARLGARPVAGWVVVPIFFSLRR
jgi:protein TonB